MGDRPVQLAISELEQLLCGPEPAVPISALYPRAADAWTMALPGLASLPRFPPGAALPRICIASEQFAGPVRNGGIGNTYASLAFMLADAGFDVTALYLRGDFSETHSIDYWIDDFAAKGVKLVPVPDYAAHENLQTGSDRWMHAPYNMLRYLIDHPMDVVHVSEWRGSSYLCLLAKRQGLAFAKTLFAVKTSSPWVWNRLYGGHVIEKAEDLAKVVAERRSVELADIVIGGSLHLLRWMASQGYALARNRTFVQPNVARLSALTPFLQERDRPAGTRIPIDELVFFGRLEPRKGLFIFCQAIRRLIRSGVPLPPRITFMGKVGGRMPSHPDLDVPDYIRMMTEGWPTEVQIQTGFQQFDAVKYLLGGARLAVMPSIIENSSMAVYEAAICGIPCVASDVGGNSELILAEDHAEVLCQPTPASLGDKLEEALRLGGFIPRPSFDNDANLETWMEFHRQLGGDLHAHLLQQSQAASAGDVPTAAVCIYFTGDLPALEATLTSLAAQRAAPLEVLIAVDADEASAFADAQALAQTIGIAATAVEAYDLDAGAAFNLLAERARADCVLFLWEGAVLGAEALTVLPQVAATSGADVLTYLHRVIGASGAGARAPELRGLILGSPSELFFRSDARELPLFVRRAAFAALGGFTADYRVLGHDHEFVAKAQLAGLRCETAMIELGSIVERSPAWMRAHSYDLTASTLRAMRPMLAAAPLALRDLLLFSRNATLRPAEKGKGKDAARGIWSADPLWSSTRAFPAAAGDKFKAGKGGAAKPGPSGKKSKRAVAMTEEAEASAPDISAPDIIAGARDHEAGRSAFMDIWSESRRAGADLHLAGLHLDVSDHLAAMVRGRTAFAAGMVVGRFLGIHRGRMYGWACDIADPRRVIELELTMEGARSRHSARQRFGAFADVPPEAMRHGFVIDLPEQYRQSRDMLAIVLRVVDAPLLLAEGGAVPPGVSLDQCGLLGECEKNDEGLISGWARYPFEPDRHVELAAYVDGAFIARFRADLYHRGEGRACGFAWPLPPILRDGTAHKIDVVVAELGIPLLRSPLSVKGLKVRRSGWKSIWKLGA